MFVRAWQGAVVFILDNSYLYIVKVFFSLEEGTIFV